MVNLAFGVAAVVLAALFAPQILSFAKQYITNESTAKILSILFTVVAVVIIFSVVGLGGAAFLFFFGGGFVLFWRYYPETVKSWKQSFFGGAGEDAPPAE